MASQPSREEEARAAESSRKWRKLRNVSRREGWASRTRRNAQTRTLVRGRGRAREVVGPEESLKKKKLNSKKDTVTYTHSKTLFSGGGKLFSPVTPTCHTPTNPCPYPAPDVQV